MKKRLILLGMMTAMILISASMAHSQSLINKLKKKAEEKLIEKAFDEKKDTDQQNQDYYYETDETQSSGRNTKGSGLTTAPPDVNASIADAEKTFNGKEFSKTRHSIRQAILGIEMEIGQNILADLPEQIDGLSVNSEMDKVTSNSMGFVGLSIERTYQGGDQELKISIGNEGLLPATVNIYQGTTVYETSADQNQKQIDYKGYNSLLEYDDYEGYTLSVPFGQSSVMVVNGINFADEQEIMKAANQIDIEKIKNQLGEK